MSSEEMARGAAATQARWAAIRAGKLDPKAKRKRFPDYSIQLPPRPPQPSPITVITITPPRYPVITISPNPTPAPAKTRKVSFVRAPFSPTQPPGTISPQHTTEPPPATATPVTSHS